MNDPLLTDRAPGIIGRQIVAAFALLARGFFILIFFIPVAVQDRDIRVTLDAAKNYLLYGDGGPSEPEPVATTPALSARARKLYARLCDGEFYATHASDTPQAMQELVDAGLVGTMGRVISVGSFYVPSESEPFKLEVIRGRSI